MFCLDTDMIVAFLRDDAAAIKKLKQLQMSGTDIAVTTVTLSELYKGAFLSVKRDAGIAFVNEFLEGIALLTQNKLSCLLFGQDYALLKNKGLLTGEMDLMIASICKAHDCVLVTRNIKDFKNIPELMIEKW